MSKKATGIVAYFGWLGFILATYLGDRRAAKEHLNRALVIHLALTISLPLILLESVGGIFLSLSVALAVLALICVIFAAWDEDVQIPFIDRIRLFK